MIIPKNETEEILLSITKNCETLIQQTHRKPEGTSEFKMIRSREILHFHPPKSIEGSWIAELVSLENKYFYFQHNST